MDPENNLKDEAFSIQSLKKMLICHLPDIYPNNYNSIEDAHIPRYDEISKRFSKIFGIEVQYFLRVPGIVNIMGDPLKSYGFDPLCITLDQDIVFAFALTNKKDIVVHNSQNAIYPPLVFAADISQKFDEENNYLNLLLSGLKAALQDTLVSSPKGISLFISSNLPIKGGLMSSSALLLGMFCVTSFANNLYKRIVQEEIHENLIKFEKIHSPQIQYNFHISSLLFNRKGTAYYKKKSYELPKKYNFIIANSLTPTPTLFISGNRQYKRLVECRIGVLMMMKKMEMKDFSQVKNLSELQNILDYSNEEMIILLNDSIEKKSYKIEEIEMIFEMPIAKLIADVPYVNNVLQTNKEFQPYDRCAHIFNENIRIENSIEILSNNTKSDDEKAEEIARLFNESFKSQQESFDCVTEEVEILRKMMLNYGVLGCRLASEGWGGHLIGISLNAKSNKIVEFLMKDYYSDPKNKIFVSDDLNMLVFQTNAGDSAKFIDPQYEMWF